jgi:ribosomal protein S18 acetylase RimI-like enzyme
LGKVVLSHGLSRLRVMGAKDIFVETDNYRNEAFNLYQSQGFEVIQDVVVYREDYM